MALIKASLPAKKRILTVCVRLFLEKGYAKTTVADIVQQANVSNSTFQNIFRAKDGVLTELVRFMFANQFKMARSTAGEKLPPVYVYAVETALQLTLTELNENLREIYLEAYSHREALEFIQQSTAKELYQIFGCYQPELSEDDFLALDVGSAGMMRAYMAQPCNGLFTLEKKLGAFLNLTLSGYRVPAEEVQRVQIFIASQNMRAIAQGVMQPLFRALAMQYDFSLDGIIPPKQ